MKKYHIVYFENEKDIHALGVTINAKNPMIAITKFQFSFPGRVFHSMSVKN